ncbi:MAG: hypothetical protein JXA38_07135 [Methanosarcinaceae archaeon]|nr:hypothetical protein [Methanosarcinaceae archaeon]
MKLKQITSFLIIILVLINYSGCIEGPIEDEEVTEFNVTTEEQSQKIADNYVRNMNEYKDYEGRDLELVETLTTRCPYCWSFKYEFDMVSEKNAEVVDQATVEVLVQEGEVVDVVFSAGMKDEEESRDILNVYELLGNPVYDVEVEIYGRVGLLDELFCPCFELASGGE